MNYHASVVLLGSAGVLVAGGSGTGKTALALELVERRRAGGGFGALVCDDQCILSLENGRLIARAPAPIAGLVELRGIGPVPIDNEPAAIVDLLVELVDPAHAPRINEEATRELAGARVPLLLLPAKQSALSARAILGWLSGRRPDSVRKTVECGRFGSDLGLSRRRASTR